MDPIWNESRRINILQDYLKNDSYQMILDFDIKQYSGYTHLLLLETRARDMNNFVKYSVTVRGQTGFQNWNVDPMAQQ